MALCAFGNVVFAAVGVPGSLMSRLDGPMREWIARLVGGAGGLIPQAPRRRTRLGYFRTDGSCAVPQRGGGGVRGSGPDRCARLGERRGRPVQRRRSYNGGF